MIWQFGRINLQETNYQMNLQWDYLKHENIEKCNQIYKAYCKHRQFQSVLPMVNERYIDPNTDVVCYFDENNLIAWSMIRRWNEKSVLADQFAWDYKNPKLRLGINSIKNEYMKLSGIL